MKVFPKEILLLICFHLYTGNSVLINVNSTEQNVKVNSTYLLSVLKLINPIVINNFLKVYSSPDDATTIRKVQSVNRDSLNKSFRKDSNEMDTKFKTLSGSDLNQKRGRSSIDKRSKSKSKTPTKNSIKASTRKISNVKQIKKDAIDGIQTKEKKIKSNNLKPGVKKLKTSNDNKKNNLQKDKLQNTKTRMNTFSKNHLKKIHEDLLLIPDREKYGDELQLINADTPGNPLSKEDLKYFKPKKRNRGKFSASKFEGDIVGVKLDKKKSDDKNRNVVREEFLMWPNNVVPYIISRDFNAEERAVIMKAVEEFETKSCLRWIPKPNDRPAFVHFMKGNGCYSSVGRQPRGQILSLGPDCINLGTALHEMLHAVGFLHEQSRPDRDDHVRIRYENMNLEMLDNFEKYSSSKADTLDMPYDLESIMHYPLDAFSINSGNTIEPLYGNIGNMGQRDTFSELDVHKLNKFAKCRNDVLLLHPGKNSGKKGR